MAAGRTSERRRASRGIRPRKRGGAPGTGSGSGSRSLEDVVIGAWAELRSAGVAECPVCDSGSLHADGCVDCGSELH